MNETTPPTNAARVAEPLANYRIYDCTGGGMRHDIHADTLDDAIAAGRKWIEDGDWERGEMETPLECSVREIIRVPDLSSILASPGVIDATLMPDGNIRVECGPDTVLSLLPGGVVDGSTLDADGYYDAVLADVVLPLVIDDEATDNGDEHDCSGVCPAKDAPDCSGGEHDWREPYEVVGGCRENPGVYGSGHGAIKATSVCAICGIYRTVDYGATRTSNGQQATRTTYRDADESILAWISGERSA